MNAKGNKDKDDSESREKEKARRKSNHIRNVDVDIIWLRRTEVIVRHKGEMVVGNECEMYKSETESESLQNFLY